MNKTGGNFFEEHIEKIILGIIGLVCIWFLITRVVISPNAVSYDNKKFNPGEIDAYISQKTKLLESRLDRQPEPVPPYKPRVDDFIALTESAIRDVNVAFYLPKPMFGFNVDKRVYDLPEIPSVHDVEAEHIRSVAYVPIGVINEENVADESAYEPNDIDIVTVEAKFDVAQLYKDFYESFAGDDVKEEWRDPCLAVPIFAAVQLQRQELLTDGSWSDWQIVPRAKIDSRKEMFKFVEEAEGMPTAEVKVHLIQFNDARVRKDILQPGAYKIASAKDEWFPPSLHKKYQEYQRQMEAEEKHQLKVAEKEKREQEREDARAERTSKTAEVKSTSTESAYGGRDGGSYEGGGGSTSARRTLPPRKTRTERRNERERPEKEKVEDVSVKPPFAPVDVSAEFNGILIAEKSDFAKMREPLMLWAYDDTVEHKKCYRYRIRLGIFNPIVGTNQFSERSKNLRKRVVLWSDFSDVTGPVEIPAMLCFFPNDLQETAKTVTVTVCKYVLGYWYAKDFMVKPGEVIGKTVDYEPTEAEKDITVPKKINYSTEVILVDIIPVNDWSGAKNLRSRHYFDMLYSSDGINIEHVPVKARYWTAELQAKFAEINKFVEQPKVPLRPWSGGPAGIERRAPGTGIGEGGYEGGYEGERK